MSRSVFLVDGFNLYHSLVAASRDSRGASTKWLDLRSLCESYLPLVASVAGSRAEIAAIHYFSAPPIHRSKKKQSRHHLYTECLRGTKVTVELARFKPKNVYCPKCHDYFIAYEEKETDVAIATKLIEVCHSGNADVVVIMSGDTDLAPAVRLCNKLFTETRLIFAFPYKRTNRELEKLAPGSFSIKLKSCRRHQFPNPLRLPDGRVITKPEAW